jgi:hypothetical protein
MAVFFVVGTIAGVLLVLRFKVLVLVPASLLATAVITVSGFVRGHEPGMIALTVFGAVASLQIGYSWAVFFWDEPWYAIDLPKAGLSWSLSPRRRATP